MSDTDLTTEETAALQEMQNEPVIDTPSDAAPSEAPPEPVQADVNAEPATEAPAPEFKSTRAPEKPPEGFVPHQAMHAERMKRQELERRLEAIESAQTQKADVPQYVDPLEDPEGYRRYDEYSRNQLQQQVQQQAAQQQQQTAMRQRVTSAEQLEAEFTKSTPDYQQAAQFLHQNRITELRSMGYGDQEVMQQLAQDANAIFDAGQRAGINPAQLVYLRAKEAGYSNAPAQPAPVEGVPSEADKMEALAQAQVQTRGVGTAGGGEQAGKLTVKQLSAMSEAELAKVPSEQIAAAMGG